MLNIFRSVKLKLKARTKIGLDTYMFSFVSDRPFHWRAGQHGVLEIKTSTGKKIRKNFSIASAPSEHTIMITTKIDNEHLTDFKYALLNLKKGNTVKLRGPSGSMYLKDINKQYAFLATGIGITTFRSILKQLTFDKIAHIKITLFYANNGDTHLFKQDLNEIKNELQNLSIEYIYKPNRITGQIITDKLGKDLLNTVFYLSGSQKMIKSYRRTLQGLGINKQNIKSNPFINIKARFFKLGFSK